MTIGSLLANPEWYELKIIQGEGIVSDHRLNHCIGNVTKLEKCIQYFVVKDDTGT